MKRRSIIFAFFTIVLLTAFGCKKTGDDNQPGNLTKDEATDCAAGTNTLCILDLSVKTSFSGTIADGDMGDWIRVDLTENTTYQITVSLPTGSGGATPTFSVYTNANPGTAIAIGSDELYTATASQRHYIAIESNTPQNYILNVVPAPDPIDMNIACNRMDIEADCDGDGRANPMDAFPHHACATTDSDMDMLPNNILESGTGNCDDAGITSLVNFLMENGASCTDRASCQDNDDDNDMTLDTIDVDDDNDGLIEINFLEDLDYIRHNLAGTSYKPGADADASTAGAPNSSTALCNEETVSGNGIFLCGYELARSLSFSDNASYNSSMVNTAWTTGTGWTPIGNNSTDNNDTRFNAIFEGNGNAIGNLFIDRSDTDYIGLFGYIGNDSEVRIMSMVSANSSYDGNEDRNHVGVLAGFSRGTIVSANVSGIVSGGEGNSDVVGGLVGVNHGAITLSSATVTVNGGEGGVNNVGGLVGSNRAGGNISWSYATGAAYGGGGC